MLYLVVIMFCPVSVPADDCDNLRAVKIDHHWAYRPSVEACVEFATDLLIDESEPADGVYPKVFCPRTEAYTDAYSRVIRGWGNAN